MIEELIEVIKNKALELGFKDWRYHLYNNERDFFIEYTIEDLDSNKEYGIGENFHYLLIRIL